MLELFLSIKWGNACNAFSTMPNLYIAKDQILELFIVKVVMKQKKGKEEEHSSDEEAYCSDKGGLRHLKTLSPVKITIHHNITKNKILLFYLILFIFMLQLKCFFLDFFYCKSMGVFTNRDFYQFLVPVLC